MLETYQEIGVGAIAHGPPIHFGKAVGECRHCLGAQLIAEVVVEGEGRTIEDAKVVIGHIIITDSGICSQTL